MKHNGCPFQMLFFQFVMYRFMYIDNKFVNTAQIVQGHLSGSVSISQQDLMGYTLIY